VHKALARSVQFFSCTCEQVKSFYRDQRWFLLLYRHIHKPKFRHQDVDSLQAFRDLVLPSLKFFRGGGYSKRHTEPSASAKRRPKRC